MVAFWRTVSQIDKSKINSKWMASRNALAVAVPLGIGIALGKPLGAVAIATGALNVCYSDGRDPYPQRARRMLTWTVLAELSQFAGLEGGKCFGMSEGYRKVFTTTRAELRQSGELFARL